MSTTTAALPGRATPEATAHQPHRLGKTELGCSRLGFGCYRLNLENPNHREALELALAAGVNVVDTSTNYTGGESESLVGAVMADMIGAGTLKREQLVVVSKLGYCQGPALDRAIELEESGNPYPDMVKMGPGLWHCLHPDFLAEQLELSLQRLGLETLDVCLIHNPEYFLALSASEGKDPVATYETFYERLKRAFEFLEEQVEKGKIGCYGVSSNSIVAPEELPIRTDLKRTLEVAGDGFKVVQLPMNLLEWGGVPEVLTVAREAGLGTMVNRPLNAFIEQKLVRLADFELDPEEEAELPGALDRLEALEEEFRTEFLPSLAGPNVDQLFTWAQFFRDAPEFIEGLDHWLTVEEMNVRPNLAAMTEAMGMAVESGFPLPYHAWEERYLDAFRDVGNAIEALATRVSHELVERVAERVVEALPEDKKEETMSRKALWIASSVEGIDVVLNGMRRSDYVEDSCAVLGWDSLPDAPGVLNHLS